MLWHDCAPNINKGEKFGKYKSQKIYEITWNSYMIWKRYHYHEKNEMGLYALKFNFTSTKKNNLFNESIQDLFKRSSGYNIGIDVNLKVACPASVQITPKTHLVVFLEQ